MKAIDGAFKRIETLLRYVAPGFVLLFALGIVDPNGWRGSLIQTLPGTMLALGAALAGTLIYSLHTGVLVRTVAWPYVVKLLMKRSPWIAKDDPDRLAMTVKQMMFELDTARWIRRASEDREIRLIQGELDRWASMVNFLYCTGYALMLAALIVWCFHTANATEYVVIYLIMGALLLLSALLSNYAMTDRALWAGQRYAAGSAHVAKPVRKKNEQAHINNERQTP